jgi:hypothetical protein
MRRALAAIVLTLCTSHASSAFADDAADIKKRGDDAMDTGRPADALAAYIQAFDLTHDPALLYNKGRAYQALTQYPQALEELQAFDRTAPAEMKARVPHLAEMIADLRQRVTTVAIQCDVAGAQLRLRDRTIGTCPVAAPITVNAGKGKLEASAEGYFAWTKDVDLPPGGVASLDIHLVSKTKNGILVVRSSVPATSVAIDGKAAGDAPVESQLLPGEHTVDLTREGYRSTHSKAVVMAGERREIELTMESEGGLLSRWWFWTGVGVVVAGGVVTAIALTTERSPDKGSVPPGTVVSGLHGAGFRF